MAKIQSGAKNRIYQIIKTSPNNCIVNNRRRFVQYYLYCINHSYVSLSSLAILNDPKNVVVALNRTAVFTCRALGVINFEIDNKPIDGNFRKRGFNDSSPAIPGENENEISRTLRVYGSAENNESKIVCVAYTEDLSFDRSPPAVLLVQGTVHVLL